VVAFHAHPDDESLLTGGTLARLSAEGHRVVLVVATSGEAGLADDSRSLGARRREELQRAAAELGCARVVMLGHADSGMAGAPSAAESPFAGADVELLAAELAALLREERADVLTSYDPAGGYGHPDHRQVHLVGARAAQLAGTPVVLEATVDRRALLRVLRLLGWLPGLPEGFRPSGLRAAFTSPELITHEVDVRHYADVKRRAMRAHLSQTQAGPRTLRVLLALPPFLFRRVLGREWYVENGRRPGVTRLDDVLASTTAHR